jgi:hypothetical protein
VFFPKVLAARGPLAVEALAPERAHQENAIPHSKVLPVVEPYHRQELGRTGSTIVRLAGMPPQPRRWR